MKQTKKQAIILFHEIYGINQFIHHKCSEFTNAGFDVYCPDMLGRPPFPYEAAQKAYAYFRQHIGFDRWEDIAAYISRLKETYEKVFVLGFSVGATIAWRCCENVLCDGVVACYGSRIREYTHLNPVCPTLLIFAREDTFDVNCIIAQLQDKTQLEIHKIAARHGFIDSFSPYFDKQAANCAEKLIHNFLAGSLK